MNYTFLGAVPLRRKVARFLAGLVGVPLLLLQSSVAFADPAVPVDSASPTTSITSPANGATVSGSVNVTASASDVFSNCVITVFGYQYDISSLQGSHSGGNVFTCGMDMSAVYQSQHGTNVNRILKYLIPASYAGVTKVEFYVDSVLKSTDTSSPYSFSWDTTMSPNGAHSLMAKAFDAAGNAGSSAAVSVTVNNPAPPPPSDTIAPTVSITSPSAGSTVSKKLKVKASASDNVGVKKVEFYVDGMLKKTDSSSPYSVKLNTKKLANSSHVLMAKAYDAAGNVGSASVTFTSENKVKKQKFSTKLKGANEVPSVTTKAKGKGEFEVDTSKNELKFKIEFEKLSSEEASAHIHGPAKAGENAGVLFTLPAGKEKKGVWNYPESVENDLLKGSLYVNVHSSNYPNGEIRGQIVPKAKSANNDDNEDDDEDDDD